MNWGNIGSNLLFVIVILGLGFLIFSLRLGRRPERSQAEIARTLLSEVRINQAIAEYFKQQPKPSTFEIISWQTNKAKLSFLAKSLQDNISEAFTLAENYNQQIRLARKQKSARLLAEVDTDKLKEPLEKARKGLELWLQINVGAIDVPLKYPNIFRTLFGGRDD